MLSHFIKYLSLFRYIALLLVSIPKKQRVWWGWKCDDHIFAHEKERKEEKKEEVLHTEQ